ncbi:sacsin-like [Stylophora pistillata]|uniref:Sacsin n=1 Tax=Stylophora pistillata TaxID=50429 RepID=A0A2B4SIF8_STYPI|nr:sacsin-like [Stylophora pistillata]XP_022786053.1 sacsin-like [Stylophora pistillata]PFX28348.1 Sacsin [Stylophora pistillata]
MASADLPDPKMDVDDDYDSEDDDEDDDFNLIQPSLFQQIKTILDQYPDDGQILKELIQNAEDARASHVKFLYDKHIYNAREEKLYSKGLNQFQGPALYAYNNAKFTKDDWRGIRMLSDSVKVKDPMKVGRFGLGFKSVFHLTDLPSILSGTKIGFIDPHENHFNKGPRERRTGYRWHLRKNREDMNGIPDQFLPYKGIFDCTEEVFSEGRYRGTLFRFPLRTEPSELSQTLYSDERVDRLFKSFCTDSHLVLLFLQQLESVELFVREESESEPRKIFHVQISRESLAFVREKRKVFYNAITPGKRMAEPATVTYPITIVVQSSDGNTQRHSFLVTSFCSGGGVSSKFKKLLTDKELCYLPSVGVAMAIPSASTSETPDIQGHVFCALPLPLQKKSLTGLPVHVNGFFSLSQNRRHIKTPNADQEDREKQTDKSLLWNTCLMEEVLPQAYSTLIKEATNQRGYNVPPDAIYRAWPNCDNVEPPWKRLQNPFFQSLITEKVIYTHARGGHWLRVDEAILNRIKEEGMRELIVRILLLANRNVASLPDHVLSAIDRYAAFSSEVTPSLMRRILKEIPACYESLSCKEKLCLLSFVLEDDNFQELVGLKLLPVSDRTFKSFTASSEAVFIASPEHSQELVPGLKGRFLDQDVDDTILGKLKAAAENGCTQLRLLRKENVPSLIREALPQELLSSEKVLWYPDGQKYGHPHRDWLSGVWRYIRENYSTRDELASLGAYKLPLIPVDLHQVPVTLFSLMKASKVVAKSLNDDHLDGAVVTALIELGVVVMRECPINFHPELTRTFVHPPSISGVLQAMIVSSSLLGEGIFSAIMLGKVNDASKRSFRKFITKVSSFQSKEKKLISSLPIFETLSKKFVAKNDYLCAAPEEMPPITSQRELINIKEEDSKKLARLLDVRILTMTELLCENILPDINHGHYSGEEIDGLMSFVMEQYKFLVRKDSNFEAKMKELHFVPNNTRRVKASDLFDPQSELTKALFADEDVFPIRSQYTDPSVLAVLKEIGMRNDETITAKDLYQSAVKIENHTSISTAKKKSHALMEYLSKNPLILENALSGKTLGSLLEGISWVTALEEKPSDFPKCVPFWGKANSGMLCRPKDVKGRDHLNLIGSVQPIIEVDQSSQLSTYFGWNEEPPVSKVVNHLETVISHYNKEERPRFSLLAKEIYEFLIKENRSDVVEAIKGLKDTGWIWNGDGFSCPNAVVLNNHSIDLSPYISVLPSEMSMYSHLFSSFGIHKDCSEQLMLNVLPMIKQKYDQGPYETSDVKKDLALCISILIELKPDSNRQLSPEVQEKILLPTYVKGDTRVNLAPVENCMYGEHDGLEAENEDDEMKFLLVHPNIPEGIAELFNVRSLSNCLLDPDELALGEEFGQEEKLTRRLNRLLEEYTDGFAVPKELIQNADDAGATEVCFLYDERTNEDAITGLIDEGMKHCQGPALWVHNDAEFKDKDFENITKLNGATKENDTEKIGKFGLGFNAVYNLTDVPMFVSRNHFVILDPNTFYLGKQIRNKAKPGIKLDTNKNTKKLRKFRNQFKPFNGIFGCDLHLNQDDNSYKGTLFRFPLRTEHQAIQSEIKKLVYNREQVQELLKRVIQGAEALLLFTQNVRQVSIFHLPNDLTEQLQPKKIFEVTKSLSQAGVSRELPYTITLPTTATKLSKEDQYLLKQCNFLRASSEVSNPNRGNSESAPALLSSALTLKIKSTVSEYCGRFLECSVLGNDDTWLVVSSMGKGEAMQFSKKDRSLLASAGVGVKFSTQDSLIPVPVSDETKGSKANASVFCYLPLPICSGLPVHINGTFAVSSNRRNLLVKTEDDKASLGQEWNEVLLKDCVCTAYFDLLEDLKSVSKFPNNSYQYHTLWPKCDEVISTCEALARSFYEDLLFGNKAVFSDGKSWLAISETVFLTPDLREDSQIGDLCFKVLKLLVQDNGAVIDLPRNVFDSFKKYGLEEKIHSRSYDERRFFLELFFPKIGVVPPDLRDNLVLYAIDTQRKEFSDTIKAYACISVSPDRHKLKCPSQLIHPNRSAAILFSPEDERFPEEAFRHPLHLHQLEQLGMLTDDLPWSELVERAESVLSLSQTCSKAALERVKLLIEFLEKKCKDDANCLPSTTEKQRLLRTKFLPVLAKPETFPLTWKGDEMIHGNEIALISPTQGFLRKSLYLACSSAPIIDATMLPNVERLLQFHNREVTTTQVIIQLNEAISSKCEVCGMKDVINVCNACYSFLQDVLPIHTDQIVKFFEGRNFVLVENGFVRGNQVSLSLPVDCSPYLYRIPEELVRYSRLMKEVGIRDQFQVEDFISALRQIKQDFGEQKVDSSTLIVVCNLATQLREALKTTGAHFTLEQKRSSIYLPNQKGEMRPVSELCIKDCPWIPGGPGFQFAHSDIPWPTSLALGVKTLKQEAVGDHAFGISFGQKEKLTTRLKRILTVYPCGKGLLKELVQNADDAQATEICFIKDPRNHPRKQLFDESWEPFQGPALCVYNNKPFTHSDIEGIQNLGEGNKGGDPHKTGQYGVGFNAVYHLTDIPSFMSKSDDIDVLCVFDPNCHYVPGATAQEPGRMYTETSKLKEYFPDVFHCYLEEKFPIENSTMFRFPLRTQEMANRSDLSSNPFTLEALNEMMEALKEELFEVLVFVSSVKKITLCDIDEETGNVTNCYSVEAVISENDAAKRERFANHGKQVGKSIWQRDDVSFGNVGVEKCSYVLLLRDSLGNEEKWLIVQQMGFEQEVKTSIVDAFRNRNLGMLPRGGCACLIETESMKPKKRKKRAYCFLPLPLETDLPVHINGHFALNHEARRNLWRDEDGGYRSDWNNALLSDVIASCYLTLLDEIRGFLHLPTSPASSTFSLSCSKDELTQKVNSYEKLFPHTSTIPYWAMLISAVYQGMNTKRLRYLPVVRDAPNGSLNSFKLTWFPPCGTGSDKAYFNDIHIKGCYSSPPSEEENEVLEKLRAIQRASFKLILLQTGFNLLQFSLKILEAFEHSKVKCYRISPSSVTEFYKTSLTNVTSLPIDVTKTPFKNSEGVTLTLRYCKDFSDFLDHLPGLPLLLTQDNSLRVFSTDDRKYLSHYHDILPQSKDMFVHKQLLCDIFPDCNRMIQEASVFMTFDVHGFSMHLQGTHSLQHLGACEINIWSPGHPREPNHRWICRVWSFLAEFWKSTKHNVDSFIMPLSNWSIIPATEQVVLSKGEDAEVQDMSKRHVLVPVHQAKCVLAFTKSDQQQRAPLVKAIRAVGLLELNSSVFFPLNKPPPQFSDSFILARSVVGSLENPASLLASLHHKLSSNQCFQIKTLERGDCLSILRYFNDRVQSNLLLQTSMLRRLPFYPSITGDMISLADKQATVLSSEIRQMGLDTVRKEDDIVFLEEVPELSELYRFLAFDCPGPVDVYRAFVLPNFSMLSKEARQTHLEYIKDKLLPGASESNGDKQKLLESLKTAAVITTQLGELEKASFFYDPLNKVFKVMLPEHKFPPEPLKSTAWLKFLKKIGLKYQVCPDEFKRFATKVACDAAKQRSTETDEQSKLLVSELLSRSDSLGEGLLEAVRNIEFVMLDPVCSKLQALHKQHGQREDGTLPYIAFQNTVISDHTECVWTSAHTLPKWAHPQDQSDLTVPSRMSRVQFCVNILEHLKVLSEPTLETVISHCRNISYRLMDENGNKVPEEQCSIRKSVMKKIYKFFQERVILRKEVIADLQNVPCIVVEGGARFVRAEHVVLEMSESLEIKPFLYRVPPDLGEFHNLFHHLGCSKFATMSHYAMVLEMLQKQSQGNKLHPNEINSALGALRGLLEGLEQDTITDMSIKQLYLPAMYLTNSQTDSPQVSLHKSSDLLFHDSPHFYPRLEKFHELFVVDVSKVGVKSCSSVNYKDLLMRLPPAVRPQMLSQVVTEVLADSSEGSEFVVKLCIVDSLKRKLCSEQFFRGIARLIRHKNQENEILDENVFASIKDRLRSIEFLGLNRIETKLVYQGDHIPDSEREISHFVNKVSAPAGESTWKVYVRPDVDENLSKLHLAVVQVISEVCEGLLGEAVMFIQEMLSIHPSQIWSMLDEENIRQDDSYGSRSNPLPLPGSFIPIEDHHLLNEDFEEITPGEYVGYELEDPSMQQKGGDATFIYAVIVEDVNAHEDASLLSKFYKVNIGDDKEPQEVEFADLYKFHRLQSSPLDLADGLKKKGNTKDKEMIFQQITEILVDAWRLPEKRRRKIVKRLFLRWHPEKNTGDESLCDEVLQHIHKETARLERSHGDEKDSQNFYEPFFDFWRVRAKRQHTHRERYRTNFQRMYGSYDEAFKSDSSSGVPPSFCSKNPQPCEARRWLRQAEADLRAASNDLSTGNPSYEWACFKCHQSAEKALKAVQFADDAFKTNRHNLTLNASQLDDSELLELATQLEHQLVDSTHMRYPDRMPYPQIPNDVYSAEKAREGLRLAGEILQRVRNLVPN